MLIVDPSSGSHLRTPNFNQRGNKETLGKPSFKIAQRMAEEQCGSLFKGLQPLGFDLLLLIYRHPILRRFLIHLREYGLESVLHSHISRYGVVRFLFGVKPKINLMQNQRSVYSSVMKISLSDFCFTYLMKTWCLQVKGSQAIRNLKLTLPFNQRLKHLLNQLPISYLFVDYVRSQREKSN